jgi:hypothetical protein
VALAVLLSAPATVPGQEVLREDLAQPGKTQPIQLSADEILTWMEGGRRAFLLRGNASVSQGAVLIRMPQAAAWVDEEAKGRTGVYEVVVYGEGSLELIDGAKSRVAGSGLVRMSTRGHVNIKAYARPVEQTAMPADPVYQRARFTRDGPGALAVAPPTALPGGGGVEQAVARVAPGEAPLVAFAVPSPAVPPPAAPIQLVQAQLPDPLLPGPPAAAAPVPTAPAAPAPPVTLGPIEGPGPARPPAPPGPNAGPAQGKPRNLVIRPRSSAAPQIQSFKLENDETAWVYTGGIILTVSNPGGDKKGLLDIEGDRLVAWTKGNPQDTFDKLRGPQGVTSGAMEFYIAGHVEIRYQEGKETQILRADEAYYDVGRNVAIAVRADLEIREPKLPYPIHLRAPELYQLNGQTFETGPSEVFSTILPSDPGLKIEMRHTRIQEREEVLYTIFGFPFRDPKTGGPLIEKDRYFQGRDMVVSLEGVPIFYFPYLAGRVDDPLGPLDSITGSYNRIFGFQIYSTWDVYDLIGIKHPPGQRWRLFLDYLSARGPAAGTEYDYVSGNLFGIPGKFEGFLKAWGLHDQGHDVIGSGGDLVYVTPTDAFPILHPDWRGRVLSRLNAQEMPYGFVFQGQLGLISDRNFLEQYYQNEYFNDYNENTFLYLKQQQDIWAWSVLTGTRLRPWVTETEWLPRADGFLTGQTFFDRFVYSAHASAAYAQLRTTNNAPFAYLPTDVSLNTARTDLWQQLSLPFSAGPFRIVPYLVGDLAYYSTDVNDNSVGRAYGAAGVMASIPFSKLYPDICSELLNVNGIYHKVVLSGNYYNAWNSTPYTNLPQLDRLNDDTTDFTDRQMHVQQFIYNPANAVFLTTSPVFNPQVYAIRRLLDTNIDTIDSMEVLQLDLRQRWQTKRGFPGSQHIVDWMTLDLQASVFPDTHRDNFGHLFGVLEYDWVWLIGDRTALSSSGWAEPISGGPRVFNFGVTVNRPDGTNFYLGYRQIDPVDSRAVIGSVTFPFSAKYALTASTVWDFGAHNQAYTLLLSRIGTDVQLNFGFTYNSILGTFGVTFEVVPNLLRGAMQPGSLMPGGIGAPASTATNQTGGGSAR